MGVALFFTSKLMPNIAFSFCKGCLNPNTEDHRKGDKMFNNMEHNPRNFLVDLFNFILRIIFICDVERKNTYVVSRRLNTAFLQLKSKLISFTISLLSGMTW